jgi:hypothetical protein
MGQAMRKVKLINRKRDIMRQISDLAREGWKAAKTISHSKPSFERSTNEAYGGDEPCECCANPVDGCICNECPICRNRGDPRCYEGGHEVVDGPNVKLEYNKRQLRNQIIAKIEDLKQQIANNEAYLAQLEADGADTV